MTHVPTPDDVLDYWIGTTRHAPDSLKDKHKLWFGKSDQTDAEIRDRFLGLLEDASHLPFADDWATDGPRGRLAAIIVLDQFSRNLFRGEARAFRQDSLALRMCKDGLALNEHKSLSETERVFFCLPLEHSEALADQERSVVLFQELVNDARPEFKEFARSTLDYAEQHLKVIQDFGRFPHRNEALGRETTSEEAEWLAEGGGF
jgi:uncharacterized protein (DUF924 family)